MLILSRIYLIDIQDLVYDDLVMTFQRDASGNFGFGTLFPELTQNSP